MREWAPGLRIQGAKDDQRLETPGEILCHHGNVTWATRVRVSPLHVQVSGARTFQRCLAIRVAVAAGSPRPPAASRSVARARRIARRWGYGRGRPGSPARPGPTPGRTSPIGPV